jgi:glyoxylase-like metal-dependent hydrolase (beta-lactamase superfamily II)
MVDSQFAPLTEKIVAAIRQITDRPIRFMVNTHVHGDHMAATRTSRRGA